MYEKSLEYLKWILQEQNIDMEDQNFKDTPKRWVSFLSEFNKPYNASYDLQASFVEPEEDIYKHAMIVQTGIPYQAMCAHHLAPVLGRAHVGYIPSTKVVGLSKLTRVVYGFAHEQPSLQEDVGNKIVDALMEHLEPLGAMCVIKAEHGCMAARGVAQQEILTTTSSIRGVFVDKVEAREEFYRLVDI